jgi:hypothetical protein
MYTCIYLYNAKGVSRENSFRRISPPYKYAHVGVYYRLSRKNGEISGVENCFANCFYWEMPYNAKAWWSKLSIKHRSWDGVRLYVIVVIGSNVLIFQTDTRALMVVTGIELEKRVSQRPAAEEKKRWTRDPVCRRAAYTYYLCARERVKTKTNNEDGRTGKKSGRVRDCYRRARDGDRLWTRVDGGQAERPFKEYGPEEIDVERGKKNAATRPRGSSKSERKVFRTASRETRTRTVVPRAVVVFFSPALREPPNRFKAVAAAFSCLLLDRDFVRIWRPDDSVERAP